MVAGTTSNGILDAVAGAGRTAVRAGQSGAKRAGPYRTESPVRAGAFGLSGLGPVTEFDAKRRAVDLAFVGFPQAEGRLAAKDVLVTGTPVRTRSNFVRGFVSLPVVIPARTH